MIRIYKDGDFVLDLSRISELITKADSVIIKLFTTNTTVFCEYSKEDITDNKIDVSYDRIQGIGEGVITCRYDLGFDSEKYPDLQQNVIGQFTTNYYLASGEIVPSEDEDHILSGVAWGNIVGSLDSQTDLATRLNQKVNNSTFQTYSANTAEAINDKVDYTEFANEIEDLNIELDSKADLSGLTALQMQVDNLPTSDIISGLNSKIDSHTANTVVHVTQADKNNWNSKQTAGDYATNTKVNQVDTKVDNVDYKLANNYYNKGQVDVMVNNVKSDVDGDITRVENNLNNYLSTAQATATYLTKKDAANTYQPKNDYATNTQVNEKISSLSGYVESNFMRKAEPVIINQTETTVTINPNVLNVWGEVEELEISFAEVDSTKYNEFMIQFYSGAIATTLVLPSNVQWLTEPTINSFTTYQISIVNNLGIMEGWNNE